MSGGWKWFSGFTGFTTKSEQQVGAFLNPHTLVVGGVIFSRSMFPCYSFTTKSKQQVESCRTQKLKYVWVLLFHSLCTHNIVAGSTLNQQSLQFSFYFEDIVEIVEDTLTPDDTPTTWLLGPALQSYADFLPTARK